MPEYKFTEIAINSTEKKKPTEADKDTYIGLEHLDAGTLKVTRWGADVAPIGEKLLMRKGDVLFGKRRAYQKKVGIAPFNGIFSAHGMVLRPKEDVITKEYFPLFISSDYFLNEAIRISVGSLSPTVNWKDLRDLTFNIPTIEEQKQIEPLVWAAIETKNSYKTLIERTDELVKSQFIENFTNVLNENYKSLREVCTLITDGTHNPPKFVDTGIPFILVSNVTGNVVTYDTPKYITEKDYEILMGRTPIEKGDVLMSTVGSYGHPAVVTDERKFAFQRHIAQLKPNSELLDSRFLHTALLSADVQEQIEVLVLGVAQKTLNLSAIKQIRIPVPAIAEQKKFILFIQQADKSKFVCANQGLLIEKQIRRGQHVYRSGF